MTIRRRSNGARPVVVSLSLGAGTATELDHMAVQYGVNRSILADSAMLLGLEKLGERLWEYRDRGLTPAQLVELLTHGAVPEPEPTAAEVPGVRGSSNSGGNT